MNYNTKELLDNCIESIYAQTEEVEFETIVVDNASSDGSEEFIKEKYPFIKWINSGGNVGFGKANNIGAEHAAGEFLFLLNPDTILKNNVLKLFYQHMKENANKDQLGALGCYLLDDNELANLSYGKFPSPSGEFSYLWGKLKRKKHIFSTKDVDYIIGADIFLSNETFKRLNGFDPKFFMYYEETDLQYRMEKEGLKRRIITGPQIIHLEGGSFQKKGLSFNRFMMSQKSYNYYLRKHFSGLRYSLYRIVLIIIRLLLFVSTDWSRKEKLMAYRLVVSGSYT